MTDQNPSEPNAAGQNAADQDPSAQPPPGPDAPRTETADLRVVVDRIEGRSVCGLAPGDYVEITHSSQLRIPEGRHFCMYALASVLPLLPAKQRALQDGDWLASDSLVACPDPDERLIMRIERIGHSSIPTEELT
ncbi:TIGR04076 family protein [Pseudactinotalea sp. Z1739]|uniref:TIGR04076 family protein n=1 Tax=Pseudactinotalea sp. Z1739 TaxID=3413028 RepID=UPI003C7D2D56